MDNMEVEFEYRREDENFRSIEITKRMKSHGDFTKSGYALIAMLPIIILALLAVSGTISLLGIILCLVTFKIWKLCQQYWLGSAIINDTSSPIFGRKVCRIDDKGIGIESDVMKQWISWGSIREINETPIYICLYYDLIRGIVLPKTSFKSEQDLNQFLALIRKFATLSKIGEQKEATLSSCSPFRLKCRPGGNLSIVFILLLLGLYVNGMFSSNYLDSKPDVEVTVDKTSVADDTIVILGKVHNPGKSDWHVSMLEMEFYNAEGNFIDRCMVYTYDLVVKAGATDNLKASCGVPRKGDADRGNFILPTTLKHFDHIQIKASAGYKSDFLSPLSLLR